MAVSADSIIGLGAYAPPALHAMAARLVSRNRWFNLVVSNIPAPQVPMYLAGAQLMASYPAMPLGESCALSIACTSLGGTMSFGLTADWDALPDIDVLARGIERSLHDSPPPARLVHEEVRRSGRRPAGDHRRVPRPRESRPHGTGARRAPSTCVPVPDRRRGVRLDRGPLDPRDLAWERPNWASSGIRGAARSSRRSARSSPSKAARVLDDRQPVVLPRPVQAAARSPRPVAGGPPWHRPLGRDRLPEAPVVPRAVEAVVALCGRQLGPLSERYGSAFAAEDLVAVLDALGIDRIDLYGDSYGTFFAQTFAVRYPERTRTLTLDAAYPIDDDDAWWRDTNRAIAAAFNVTCARDRVCAELGRDPMATIARLVRRVGAAPASGGIQRRRASPLVRVNVDSVISLVTSAATTPTIYRELVAAARPRLRANHPDPAPLLRLAAENAYVGGAGDIHTTPKGSRRRRAATTTRSCGTSAPRCRTASAVRGALGALRRDDPVAFAPFAIDDWVVSSSTLFTSCIRWPAPTQHVPAKPPGATYPDVPVLVLNGVLDSADLARRREAIADRFPNATYVEVPNTTHVTALGDLRDCTSRLVLGLRSNGRRRRSVVRELVPAHPLGRPVPDVCGIARRPMIATRAALVGDRDARGRAGAVVEHERDTRRGAARRHVRDPRLPPAGVHAARRALGRGRHGRRHARGGIGRRVPLAGWAHAGGRRTCPSSWLQIRWNVWHPMGGASCRFGRRQASAVVGVRSLADDLRRANRRPGPASDRAPPVAARVPRSGKMRPRHVGWAPARLPRTPAGTKRSRRPCSTRRDIGWLRAHVSRPAAASPAGLAAPHPGTHRGRPVVLPFPHQVDVQLNDLLRKGCGIGHDHPVAEPNDLLRIHPAHPHPREPVAETRACRTGRTPPSPPDGGSPPSSTATPTR